MTISFFVEMGQSMTMNNNSLSSIRVSETHGGL